MDLLGFPLLKVAFASHPRVDSLIRAYEAGCPIHNSPAKPFGSCGYELLKILALEFSLKTRTEASCLRAELLRRDFRLIQREPCCFRSYSNGAGCSQ